MNEARRVLAAQAELGEGPIWSAADRAVWFVDVKGRAIWRFRPRDGDSRRWAAPEQVSFVVPAIDGGFVVGLQSGPARFDPDTGAFRPLGPVEGLRPEQRLNDAHVDAAGRLWFGVMHDEEADAEGGLYRLDPDGVSRRVDGGYVVPNGPATSPDGRTLYHVDTLADRIFAFDLGEDGALANRREAFRVERPGAHPDGPVVDVEGALWIGLFGGAGLERRAPDGRALGFAPLPASNVTKACFGDDDLRTLYVTTAKLHLDPARREAETLAGDLFAVRVEVAGPPQNAVRVGL